MLTYQRVFRLMVRVRLDGEAAHTIALVALGIVTAIPGAKRLLRGILGPQDPGLRVQALGKDFASPLGLAAGVDSNATSFEGLGALGFAFVEVGTVTARQQPGNTGRRVFRLVGDRAILNRRGFPNDGASAVAHRLRGRPTDSIVGVNVGKTKDVPLDEAGGDYQASLRQLAPLADYAVLNVSSPNTPGLREMQSVERLRQLIDDARREIEATGTHVPLLIKIAPDLTDEELDAISDLAVSARLDGIIAVNTTTKRDDLTDLSALPEGVTDGGISGAPLKRRAVEVLRRLRARVGDKVTLISVGGIETPDDAWDRILAGATLVQAHTAFVYGGPLWPRSINRGLSRRLRDTGLQSIQEMVGAGKSPGSSAGDLADGPPETMQTRDTAAGHGARRTAGAARVA